MHTPTYPVQLKVGQFAAITYDRPQVLLDATCFENLTAAEAAVLRKFFPTGYSNFPDEEAENSPEEAADSTAET